MESSEFAPTWLGWKRHHTIERSGFRPQAARLRVVNGTHSRRHGLRAGESLTKKGSVSARGERAVGMVPGRQTLLLLSCRSYGLVMMVLYSPIHHHVHFTGGHDVYAGGRDP